MKNVGKVFLDTKSVNEALQTLINIMSKDKAIKLV